MGCLGSSVGDTLIDPAFITWRFPLPEEPWEGTEQTQLFDDIVEVTFTLEYPEEFDVEEEVSS